LHEANLRPKEVSKCENAETIARVDIDRYYFFGASALSDERGAAIRCSDIENGLA
jgi:hypothetical protein